MKKILRKALEKTSTGIDRGAWSDVPDASKWVDELRGDEVSEILKQSEREGWRYAKECESEIKRLQELADYRLKLLTKMPSEWVGLTDEDMKGMFLNAEGIRIARYIETRLKEMNNA